MKYFLLLLGSGLAVTSVAHAQLGVRLGGSLAKFHTTEGQVVRNTSSALAGYQVGITYRLPLTARLTLVPEAQYSYERLKSNQVSFGISDGGFTAYTQLGMHYLNVPVLMRATFGPAYIEAGPQGSWLLGGRQTGTNFVSNWSGVSQAYEVDQPATQDNHRFDVGPCLGLGVRLPAGLGLSVRAYQGLTALNGDRSRYEGGCRRQSLQAAVTYQLPTR